MAVNDLQVANFCFSEYKRDDSPFPEHLRPGAGMYLIRIQVGHLAEAMKVLRKVRRSPSLIAIIPSLPAYARKAWDELKPCTSKDPPEEYKRHVLQVRDKMTFHYDDEVVGEALEYLVSQGKRRGATAMWSDEPLTWRFNIADLIVDTYKCRIVWEIPPDVDVREQADRQVMYAHGLAVSLLDFSGAFVFSFLEKHSAV